MLHWLYKVEIKFYYKLALTFYCTNVQSKNFKMYLLYRFHNIGRISEYKISQCKVQLSYKNIKILSTYASHPDIMHNIFKVGHHQAHIEYAIVRRAIVVV